MSLSSKIHPTAIIDPSAKIGEGTTIGPYSVIGGNVSLGKNVKVASHVVVEGYTTIGDGTEIFQFASIGSKPQDLKYKGEKSTVAIGKNNIIREYVTIQPGTENGIMTTTVGDSNLFMASSHVGHDSVIGDRNVFANQVGLSGHVTVHNNTVVGGMVGVHQFVRIGSFSMVAGGSKLGQDIPPYCVGQGDRCMLRGVNIIGLQRAGFSSENITDVKRVYRSIFSSKSAIKSKIEALPLELSSKPHIEMLISFIQSSERGICSPAKSASAAS